MASINFLNEIIDYKKYRSTDSKITAITVNPITYHAEVEIDGKKEKFDIQVMKSGKSFTVSLSNTHIRPTFAQPLHISGTDLDLALKQVLDNWENLYLHPSSE